MDSASLPSKSIFPSEPLDSRDVKILVLVCKHGKAGQSFNKLVEEARPFASRSTFALRVERLQRLNYLEKLPDKERKQIKRLRGSLQARMLMWQVERMTAEAAEIEKQIIEKEETIFKRESMSPEDISAFGDFFKTELAKIKGLFGSVAVVAVTYGEGAAGDIFLPSVTENFRNIIVRLASIVKKKPELTQVVLTKEKPPDETIKEAKLFFDEFGEEILERLPKNLPSRNTIVEEIMKNPERLSKSLSALWVQS